MDTQSKPKRLHIVEVKRMADLTEDYWLRGTELAEQQYADLCEGIRNRLPQTWECRFVQIILCTMGWLYAIGSLVCIVTLDQV